MDVTEDIPIDKLDVGSNFSDTEPSIVDVTEAYRRIDDFGEAEMNDNAEESIVTFPTEAENRRRLDLEHLSKDALIDLVIERERLLRRKNKMIQRLRQVKIENARGAQDVSDSEEEEDLDKSSGEKSAVSSGASGPKQMPKKRKAGKPREIDFSAYGKRHVAILFAYLGWNYDGFVVQDETTNTVEDYIFDALIKTKLIESRETSNYHRCGRTDKTVSAFSQVISLTVRSHATEGKGVIVPCSSAKATKSEVPYVQMLNGVLPKGIRVISWAPVDPDFSARFSCKGRKYRYYFPKANLDVDKMNEAAQFLVGEHDFRNLCKADINGGVTNYKRRIDKVFVKELDSESSSDSSKKIYVLHVYGSAFLWHQVRSIAAILFLVGQHKEEPKVIQHLLNVAECPAKPQYSMAEGFPLVLFDCEFPELNWDWDEQNLRHVVKDLETVWTEHAIKASVISDMLRNLKSRGHQPDQFDLDGLLRGIFLENRLREYQKLRSRRTCDTIEDRLSKKMKTQ